MKFIKLLKIYIYYKKNKHKDYIILNNNNMYISYNSKIVEKFEFKTLEDENIEILQEFKIMILDIEPEIKLNNINILNIKYLPQNEFHYFIYKYENIVKIYQFEMESKYITNITEKCDIDYIINHNEWKLKNKNDCIIS